MSAKKDTLKVSRVIGGLVDDKKALRAITTIWGETQERIFVRGRAADGSNIGSYSTDPIYVNPKTSPGKGFSARGKDGKSTFDNGRRKVTRYFPGGYREYKKAIGQDGTVNLWLSGQMRASWLFGKQGDAWVLGFATKAEADKAAANERRFGKTVFALTQTEITLLLDKLI